jgi:hypothetical protein
MMQNPSFENNSCSFSQESHIFFFFKFEGSLSKRMRWLGHVAKMRKKRNACRILVGKPEGRRPLGRPIRKWRIV